MKSTVSPLSNNMRIAIAPDRIAATTSAGVVQHALGSKTALPDTSQLQAALGKLSGANKPEIILSQAIATVWLFPAPPIALKSSEMEGWVMDMAQQRLGARAAELSLSWDSPPPRSPILVTGIASDFLQTLIDALDRAGLTAQRIEPWLAPAYRDCKAELHADNTWLGLAEAGHVSLSRFSASGAQVLRSSACDPAKDKPIELLQKMLQREMLVAGISQAPILLLKGAGLSASEANLRALALHPLSLVANGLEAMLGAGHA